MTKSQNEYLGPGFTSISPHCISKFEMQRDRNMVGFTIFRGLVNEHRKDFADFLVKTRSRTCWTLVKWSIMTLKKKNRNEKLIGFVKAGSFLVFNFILGNDFKV